MRIVRASDFPVLDVPFAPFAHRGGALYPPNLGRENTLHAFSVAVAMGYRYLETDVHATSDGVLIAFHDSRLERVTDASGVIAQTPYEVIRRARIGGQDPIPTLSELFSAFPDCRFNIDAKSSASVELLAAAIAEHEAYDRVCVGSFGTRRLHRLRRLLGGRVASAASPVGVAVNRFVPWVTAVLNTSTPVLQLPVDHRILGRRLEVLTGGLLEAVHRAGKHVHVWTIDDRAEMDRLIDIGVDGIFTDRIDILKQALTHRGLWTGTDRQRP
jgi:glycerophosphoryl diester phosphodiesterase